MGKRKRRKGGVAQPQATKYAMTLMNFRLMVKNYMIAKMCQDACEKAQQVGAGEYFRGIVQGYEDCFGGMNAKEADVNVIIRELDEHSVKKEACDLLDKMFKETTGKKSQIIMPGNPQVARAAKELFDQHVSIGRFKK